MSCKRLLDLSEVEQKEFFDSFDTVLTDVDGVFYSYLELKLFDGAAEAYNTLKDLGKKIYLVTNNNTVPIDLFLHRFKEFDVKVDQLIRPSFTIQRYLKSINFDKELYVVGFRTLRDELIDAGFNVVYDEPAAVAETVAGVADIVKNLRPNVGAVLVDVSVNVNYLQIQRCIEYINRRKAILLAGAWDTEIPFSTANLVGPIKFVQLIQDLTGAEVKILTKPGKEFQKVMENTLQPNPKRTLFIGDSITTDMTYATNAGFKKLLCLSGVTSKAELDNWTHDTKIKPDYVVDTINNLYEVAKKIGITKSNL